MINYSKGKIYKLVSDFTDQVYIGSTTQTLYQRKAEHSRLYKAFSNGAKRYSTSFEIIKHGDFDIVLIEDFPCSDRSQLEYREGDYIKKFNCVNKNITGRTQEEKHDLSKEYITCECGGTYQRRKKQPHIQSAKHQIYLEDSKHEQTDDEILQQYYESLKWLSKTLS